MSSPLSLDNETLDLIMKRISNRSDEIYGYEEEKSKLQEILSNTIQKRESGFVIIYGARGSGKTSLVNHCLKNIPSRARTGPWIIRLDGAIHSTDASALNVIAKELELDDLNSAMEVSLGLEEKCKKSSKSFFFILKEFDIFCRRQQMLLYTLFDALHLVPGMCLIGLTTRSDCLHLIEKRVRSRMDFGKVFLSTPFTGVKEYMKYALQLLDNKIEEKELQQSLLPFQYQIDATPRELKHFLVAFLLNRKSLPSEKCCQSPLFADHIIDLLESLTQLEFGVVCIVSTYLKAKGKDDFRPVEIYPKLEQIPKQVNHSVPLFYHALNRLVDYGLLVICPGQRTNAYLSDWTLISLNVSRDQIDSVFKRDKLKLPGSFEKLLHVN